MPGAPSHAIRVVDSHTGGEPTRVVVSGGPDLGSGPLPERVHRFRTEFDAFRSAIVNEPRGSDVVVGALLVPPTDPACTAAVIYFNNVGYLGMCGHGTIGLMVTLAHLRKITPGTHKLETPVGIITSTLHPDGSVSLDNVPSYRKVKAAPCTLPDGTTLTGDVAWGGNWFYLVENHGLAVTFDHIEALTDLAWKIRKAINAQGFPEIDHVELFGPPTLPHAHSKNFVLCPGKAYDRSPCGTGTSAKLACLAADGKLLPGQPWIQESIIASTFTASYRAAPDNRIIPTLTGTAFITAESTLLLNEHDPFRWGIGL